MKYAVLARNVLVSGCIILLPSCGRIMDWGMNSLNQGTDVEQTIIPQQYIRSVTVYDQFTTLGMFDVLWLSDDIRTIYTDVYAMKYGKTEERKIAFLRRQLEENRRHIAFYMLCPERLGLGESKSEWGLFLQVGSHMYAPTELRKTDLDPVYQSFFGKKWNPFKIPYSVKFEAHDSQDAPILTPETPEMALIFRSTLKEVKLVWKLSDFAKEMV
jgi:hypothetical protein